MTMFRPSTYPWSRRPARSRSSRTLAMLAEVVSRYPRRTVFDCCCASAACEAQPAPIASVMSFLLRLFTPPGPCSPPPPGVKQVSSVASLRASRISRSGVGASFSDQNVNSTASKAQCAADARRVRSHATPPPDAVGDARKRNSRPAVSPTSSAEWAGRWAGSALAGSHGMNLDRGTHGILPSFTALIEKLPAGMKLVELPSSLCRNG